MWFPPTLFLSYYSLASEHNTALKLFSTRSPEPALLLSSMGTFRFLACLISPRYLILHPSPFIERLEILGLMAAHASDFSHTLLSAFPRPLPPPPFSQWVSLILLILKS